MKSVPALPPVALAAGTIAAGTIAAGTIATAWAVRGKSSSVFAPSHWRGMANRKSVALTFDDGPSPHTPTLLKLLGQYRIPATFFQIGQNATALPEIAREVVLAGHEIANHSQTHPNLALQRPTVIRQEFGRAQETIGEVTGTQPKLLRAPFGVRWFGFREMQQALGLTGIMWSVIGRDWVLPAHAIADRVLNRTGNGSIICLHDGRGTLKDPDAQPTLEAVRRIVPELLEKGYHFETVTQLLWPMK